MNQKLVTRKNRKVRQLRDFYPEIKIKVLYQRDYLHLVAKYGLDGRNGRPVRNPTRCPGPPRVVQLTDRGGGGPEPSGSAHGTGRPPLIGVPPGSVPADEQEIA